MTTATKPQKDELTAFTPDEDLQEYLSQFIQCVHTLNQLDAERENFIQTYTAPDENDEIQELSKDAKSEFSRQSREISRLPDLEQSQKSFDAVSKKIDILFQKMEEDKEFLPQQDHLQAMSMAGRQIGLVVRRAQMIEELLNICSRSAQHEKLYQTMTKRGIDTVPLYGWAIFQLGLEFMITQFEAQMQEIELLIAEAQESSAAPSKTSGLKGLLGRKKQDTSEEAEVEVYDIEKGEQEKLNLEARLRTCKTELENAEKPAVEAYWETYYQVAAAFVKEDQDPEEELYLRAMLRYGLIGESSYYLMPSLIKRIIDNCRMDIMDMWDFSQMAFNVYYADEYIHLVATGQLTPSMDEDLELNQRNTPPWKKDKAWRNVIMGDLGAKMLGNISYQLDSKVKEYMDDAEHALELMNDFKETGETKAKIRQQKEIAMEAKANATRTKQNLEKFKKDMIPKAEAKKKDGQARLGEPYDPAFLATKESKEVRRLSSLTNRLKQPYLPLLLRTAWDPEKDAIVDRDRFLSQLELIDMRDQLMFKDEIIKHNKADRRVYLRTCPMIMLTPAIGYMGFSWAPRSSTEVGRIVFPGYMPRGDILESIAFTTFADFRWDTAKESAGSDLMNSETICAAYMGVRWDYRKKSKEGREKAGIMKDQTDRENFRRHYSLYMASADDGGKQLFYKCYECYVGFLKYVQLPAGVEKLEKN